jgi:hypothetical protein
MSGEETAHLPIEDSSKTAATPTMPPAAASTAAPQLSLVPASGSMDMMSQFEMMTQHFKAEVEALAKNEKTAAEESARRLESKITELEDELEAQTEDARAMAKLLRRFVAERQSAYIGRIFASDNPPEEPQLGVAELRAILEAFIEVNEQDQSPELEDAMRENRALKATVDSKETELQEVKEQLETARILKTQEEKDLIEFQSLRACQSELQDAQLELSQVKAQLQELTEREKANGTKVLQHESLMHDKGKKIVELVQRLEDQTEQCRLLSDENTTLKLELGKDSDYIKVVKPPEDPLTYRCKAGKLSDELESEGKKLIEELQLSQMKFPGIQGASENYRGWGAAQLSRMQAQHCSFLHRFQDFQEAFPAGTKIEFVSEARDTDNVWAEQEEKMRDADKEFQLHEKEFTNKWEEVRLKLAGERDEKVKQLLDQAESSKSKAEKQLLVHQAKLFGQRIDAQIERAWSEQKADRDRRWAEHQRTKNDTRQRLKDDSLSVHQKAEESVSASDRFQDMAKVRLAAVEDAWLRNSEKAGSISTSALKTGGLEELLKSAGVDKKTLPAAGSQHAGVNLIVDAIEELMSKRIESRHELQSDLADQTMQQLRICVEKFIAKEAGQQKSAGGDEEDISSCSQAKVITSLLQMRQHRTITHAMRRQFTDYLLVLKLASVGAARLMPDSAGDPWKVKGTQLDIPPPPAELLEGASVQMAGAKTSGSEESKETSVSEAPAEAPDEGAAAEGQFLYNTICKRLLERALTVIHQQHRQELLQLKREYTVEIRNALLNICQIEKDAVASALERDLKEYEMQVRARLLSDCEYHLCEERKQLGTQVDDEVELHIAKYKRQVLEEEFAAVKERRKFLTERLVVIQANPGSIGVGERAVMQRLRQELRACEAKIEAFELENLPEAAPSKLAPSPKRPSSSSSNGRKSPRHRPGSGGQASPRVMPSPTKQPKSDDPQPPPQTYSTYGRPPPAPQAFRNAAMPSFGAPPRSPDFGTERPPPAGSMSPQQQQQQQHLIQQHLVQQQLQMQQQMLQQQLQMQQQMPVYVWPFELPISSSPPKTPRSLSAPISTTRLPKMDQAPMPPLQPLNNFASSKPSRPSSEERRQVPASQDRPLAMTTDGVFDELLLASDYSGLNHGAGHSLAMPPSSNSSNLKQSGRREMPPLLPPVQTPRSARG